MNEGDSTVAARAVIGLSSTSVGKEPVVLVVTITGTCSFVYLILAAATMPVTVSGVVMKVRVSVGGDAALEQVLLLGCS